MYLETVFYEVVDVPLLLQPCRQPGPCSYNSSSAWAFLQKHVPSVVLAAAATQALATRSAAFSISSSGTIGSNAKADSMDNHTDAAENEAAREWYDLGRALQHVRPRVPAWGFAPLPTVLAGFRSPGGLGSGQGFAGGVTSAGLELLYDVHVTLVKRRTPGMQTPVRSCAAQD
jgi:hypothetical protein